MTATHFDVLVLGAGPGGFAAAVAAAKQGKNVMLVEQNAAPGGVAAFSACPVIAGIASLDPKQHNSVSAELLIELQEMQAAKLMGWAVNSSELAVQIAMTRILKRNRVKMLFYATLTEVESEKERVKAVTVCCAGQKLRFTADNFVDASGDAVLAELAGASCQHGSVEESMSKTVLMKLSGIKSFDKASLKQRFAQLQCPIAIQDHFMGTPLADGTLVLNISAVAGDALSPWELTRMDQELREQCWQIMPWLRSQFPEFAEAQIVSIAPRIGVRASRNILGRCLITCDDIDQDRQFAEVVALGKRSYGEHYVKCFSSPWRKWHKGELPIPYGALIAEPLKNLAAAGRCIAIETKAISCIRLMAHCLATGVAAGSAAALGFPKYDKLKPALLKLNCRLQAE
ncbi:MAG: FAD-dependent oxidoreductase [Lentisphaeria bacterium]|nr:FAD-dependent oxidoreductase [Lentisphaeria bacterium]MDY0176544.1 FAD-dependent oxidoreductase [Lentisphaeria bacterium]NLZ60277.1 FAD-dependent oxidoreductase [Lentisphaerota bacterium]